MKQLKLIHNCELRMLKMIIELIKSSNFYKEEIENKNQILTICLFRNKGFTFNLK